MCRDSDDRAAVLRERSTDAATGRPGEGRTAPAALAEPPLPITGAVLIMPAPAFTITGSVFTSGRIRCRLDWTGVRHGRNTHFVTSPRMAVDACGKLSAYSKDR
jgi:hypothetical protein